MLVWTWSEDKSTSQAEADEEKQLWQVNGVQVWRGVARLAEDAENQLPVHKEKRETTKTKKQNLTTAGMLSKQLGRTMNCIS